MSVFGPVIEEFLDDMKQNVKSDLYTERSPEACKLFLKEMEELRIFLIENPVVVEMYGSG